MTGAPVMRPPRDVQAHHISAGDTVKLAVLSGPRDGSDTSVSLEIWEPGGSQPPNSHSDSTETFIVLKGTGRAYSDEHVRDLAAGDVIVLPQGSTHRIENTSTTDRLYTITVMAPDDGFAALIEAGPTTTLDEGDLAVLRGSSAG